MPHVFSTTLPKAGGKVTARCPRRTAEKCCDQTSRSHANNQYITAKGPPAAARGRAQGTGGAPALAHPLLSPGPALPGAAGPGAPWRPLRAAPWDGPGRRRGGGEAGASPAGRRGKSQRCGGRGENVQIQLQPPHRARAPAPGALPQRRQRGPSAPGRQQRKPEPQQRRPLGRVRGTPAASPPPEGPRRPSRSVPRAPAGAARTRRVGDASPCASRQRRRCKKTTGKLQRRGGRQSQALVWLLAGPGGCCWPQLRARLGAGSPWGHSGDTRRGRQLLPGARRLAPHGQGETSVP